jgi:hypothetical protein
MVRDSSVSRDRRNFWNSIGKPVDPTNPLASIDLDWEPLSIPLTYEIGETRRISQQFRILVNSKTGKDIAPCSDNWTPLGNRQFYDTATRSLAELGSSVSRGGYLHGSKSSLRMGDRCVFLVSDEIPELGFSLYNDDVDEAHSSRIVFYNHHAPGSGMGIKIIVVRKICTNGLVRTGVKNGLNLAHTSKGVEAYRTADKQLQQYKEMIAAERQKLEALARVKVSEADALSHFVDFVGDKKKALAEQPVSVRTMQSIYNGEAAHVMEDLGIDLSLNDYTNGTAYGVAQSVTAYYSHFRGGYTSAESAIKSRVFTDAASAVDSALNSLARAYLPKQKQKGAVIQPVGF